MANLTRRTLLAGTTAIGLTACGRLPKAEDFSLSQGEPSSPVFPHGVASGDPDGNSVILWTRITSHQSAAQTVSWTIWPEDSEADEGKSGQFLTDKDRDWTVKIDVQGLEPGQVYLYQFTHNGLRSPQGRTRTLPEGSIDQARFAVVSCANFQTGYFSVYDHIARNPDFDAVIHLGDYFYEYGVDGWGGDFQDKSRLHQPVHEIVSLSDYRMRHAQYRTDASLQAMTASHPLIAIWDDHESANDSYKDGAQNHQADTEGDWAGRKADALKAYYEWMPVRDPAGGLRAEQRFQTYSYGDLLTLVTMETRLSQRAKPIDIDEYTSGFKDEADVAAFTRDVLHAPDRPMLGPEQTGRIVSALSRSKAAGQPWRLLANQVVMGRLQTPDLSPHVDDASILAIEADWPAVRAFVKNSAYGLPVYPDSWDGYPWAREQFYEALEEASLTDTLVLTGDAHEFWVNDLTRESGRKMGVEFGTTSVSSPTLKSYFGEATAPYSLLMTQANEDVRYYNALFNGYIDLTLTPGSGQAVLIGIDDITRKEYAAVPVASFALQKTDDSIKITRPRGLDIKQRLLFSGLG